MHVVFREKDVNYVKNSFESNFSAKNPHERALVLAMFFTFFQHQLIQSLTYAMCYIHVIETYRHCIHLQGFNMFIKRGLRQFIRMVIVLGYNNL